MRVRLVWVTTRRGARAERVSVVETDVVSIGRGSDNVVLLPGLDVSLRHATLHVRSGRVFIEPVGGNRIEKNGKASLEGQELGPDDEVRLGSARLRVRPPAEGGELHLEVEEGAQPVSEREALRSRTHTHLADRRFPVRPLAWPAFLGMLAVFVLAPLAWGRFEASWSSGELASAHRFIATDCKACHAAAFERVRDAECLACHDGIGRHARSESLAAYIAEQRCASCHADHRGPQGLAVPEQALCSECHADLSHRFAEVRVRDASDFALAHPEFTLHHATDDGEWVQSEWTPDLREEPGFTFTHLRHVGQVVADRASGEKRNMLCSDCHTPDPARLRMEPVTYEQHCRSCHGLSFDERHPEREAVHGDLEGMRTDLLEFYAGLALRGDPAAPALLRRRPGEALDEEQRRLARAWAEEQARAAAARLFEAEEACGYCHAVEADPSAPLGYSVPEVRVPAAWLEQGSFAHGTHAVFECRSCHPAAAVYDPGFAPETPRPAWSLERSGGPFVLSTPDELAARWQRIPSESAHDVLIPGIDTCRECHGGARVPEPAIASDCVVCHPFHRSDLGPLREAPGAPRAAQTP